MTLMRHCRYDILLKFIAFFPCLVVCELFDGTGVNKGKLKDKALIKF